MHLKCKYVIYLYIKHYETFAKLWVDKTCNYMQYLLFNEGYSVVRKSILQYDKESVPVYVQNKSHCPVIFYRFAFNRLPGSWSL